jgi:hypothetical protein
VYILQYGISVLKEAWKSSPRSIEDVQVLINQHLWQEKAIINTVDEGPSAINHRSFGGTTPHTACCTALRPGKKELYRDNRPPITIFGSITLARLVLSTRSVHQNSSVTQNQFRQLALWFYMPGR